MPALARSHEIRTMNPMSCEPFVPRQARDEEVQGEASLNEVLVSRGAAENAAAAAFLGARVTDGLHDVQQRSIGLALVDRNIIRTLCLEVNK